MRLVPIRWTIKSETTPLYGSNAAPIDFNRKARMLWWLAQTQKMARRLIIPLLTGHVSTHLFLWFFHDTIKRGSLFLACSFMRLSSFLFCLERHNFLSGRWATRDSLYFIVSSAMPLFVLSFNFFCLYKSVSRHFFIYLHKLSTK